VRLLEHRSCPLHLVILSPKHHLILKYNRLCGFPPFYDDDNLVLFEKIKKGQYDFPSPSWDNISSDAKNIIKSLLVVNPEKRMTPDELLRHPWVLGEVSQTKDKNVLDKMREW
jgi:calcium/calmodulin-dependent protein kinase I